MLTMIESFNTFYKSTRNGVASNTLEIKEDHVKSFTMEVAGKLRELTCESTGNDSEMAG